MAKRISPAAVVVLLFVALVLPASAAAKRKPISGKLNKPAYTVIALAKNGRAKAVRAPHRSFRLRPPANVVTLHLRAPDGVYAGPIVLGGAKKGGRAIVGVRAGARLRAIKIKRGRGYAKTLTALRKLRRNGWVDMKRWARAKKAVPIGSGNYGRVRSKQIRDSVAGDLDLDGIPGPLDIDDDGDKILDNLDRQPRKARASAHASATPAGDFRMRTSLGEGGDLQRTANVNGRRSDLSVEEFEAFISVNLVENLVLEMEILPGDSSELDCGRPQSNTDAGLGGLAYCTKGGTGQLSPDEKIPPGVLFPECCDGDGDGFGKLVPGTSPGSGFGLVPRATSDQIGSGDVLIQRVTTDGSQAEFTATVQYVFATNPAVASYNDGHGNSADIKYPVPDSAPGTEEDPFPVEAGPNGDVVVDLTFWRPQRRPIPPEAGEWIDMGGLDYGAVIGTTGEFCGKGSYSSTDPNLALDDGGFRGEQRWAGFRDLSADRLAAVGDTFTYRLNLTKCLESEGQSFDLGQARFFGFKAVTPQLLQDDEASTALTFRRIG